MYSLRKACLRGTYTGCIDLAPCLFFSRRRIPHQSVTCMQHVLVCRLWAKNRTSDPKEYVPFVGGKSNRKADTSCQREVVS